MDKQFTGYNKPDILQEDNIHEDSDQSDVCAESDDDPFEESDNNEEAATLIEEACTTRSSTWSQDSQDALLSSPNV